MPALQTADPDHSPRCTLVQAEMLPKPEPPQPVPALAEQVRCMGPLFIRPNAAWTSFGCSLRRSDRQGPTAWPTDRRGSKAPTQPGHILAPARGHLRCMLRNCRRPGKTCGTRVYTAPTSHAHCFARAIAACLLRHAASAASRETSRPHHLARASLAVCLLKQVPTTWQWPSRHWT